MLPIELADRYECLLTQYEQLLVAHHDALVRLRTLRRATKFLVAAACRTAGEYRIDIRMTTDNVLQPFTAPIGTLLGTATYKAMEVLGSD